MPGSDDRDTVVGQQDRWSPRGALPPAGWYEDPWNTDFLRLWDGAQWSGETMRKGEVGPPTTALRAPAKVGDHGTAAPGDRAAWADHDDQAPADTWAPVSPLRAGTSPAPPGPPAPPSGGPPFPWRVPNRFVLAGIGVAVAVLIAVVLLSGHGHSTTASTGLPTAPATTAAVLGLRDSVLSGADLGKGWTASPPARPLAAPEYTRGPCGSALWARDVAGYESSFVNGVGASTAHGAVVTKSFEAPSLAVADQQQTVISAASYGGCLRWVVTSQVQSQLPPGEAATSVTVTPFSLQLPASNVAYVVTVTVAGPGGTTRQVTDNSVAMVSGRYVATVDVSWSSDAPLDATIVQQQASVEAARLEALS